MRRFLITLLLAGACAAFAALPSAAPGQPANDNPPPIPGEEVEARGPVHEAYAEPTATTPEPGPTATREPPRDVEEAPPEEKPEGDNVTWIPGYWAWDADATDFLWVSGCWRALPPGKTWVPGAWARVGSEWEWTRGYWAAAGQTEIDYLPTPPPQSLDNGPETQA